MDAKSSSKPTTPTTKIDRKTIEKNRRNHMKCLQSQLNSLVHHGASSSKVTLTLSDQLDEATKYIKNLEENVSNLKRKKESLLAVNGNNCSSSSSNNTKKRSYSLKSPVQIEVHEKEKNAIEVILVTGLECQFVFTEAIRILNEELAEIVNASYSVVGITVFHSIHAKIREDATSHGVARITERLKKYAL